MSIDAILDRLIGDWSVISDSWPILTMEAAIVGGLVGVAVHLAHRKKIADLKKCLALRDDQLANAEAETRKMEKGAAATAGERQARQAVEGPPASPGEQRGNAPRKLLAAPRSTVSSSRESRRQARLDELFGPGRAMDGNLTQGEAERLIVALHQVTDLMRARRGSDRTPGSTQLPSRLDSPNGASWWLYVSRKGIPHAIQLVAAYRADVVDFANSLEAVIISQPDLESRLRRIVGNVGVIASLLNVVGGFIRSMERLNDGEEYKPTVLAMALGGPFQTMAQSQTVVDEWMDLFIEQRAPEVHQEAATYL